MQTQIDKDRPSPQWLATLRARYPTEREIDRVLTRKMERRAGPGYQPLSLQALVDGVESLLRAELQDSFAVSEARWLFGGASKLQMAFTLSWNRPGVGRESTRMVLRMEPAESIVETSRLREFQLLRAMRDTVPVPPVFWSDPHGQHLPYPALIYGFMSGVTKPASAASAVSGLSTRLPPALRDRLAPQFVEHLAAIHRFDFRNKGLDAFDVPSIGTTQCSEWGVNWWTRVWEEDADEDIPLMRLAAVWLRENMPVLDQAVVVHADYRVGNFLFTEHDSKITAWLDWELGRIGDRHQDLAWTTSQAFAYPAEDGKTMLTAGLMPEPVFIDAYERASGLAVDSKAVHWYKIYNDYMMVALTIATGYRIANAGKTHQDILVTWLMGVGSMLQNEMCDLLERGA